MAESKWTRDILLIPLIVGVLVALFSFVLPQVFSKGKRLSYSIEGPITYFNDPLMPNIAISVNGKPASTLFTYRVKIWNSGDVALNDLPVRLQFAPVKPFAVFAASHATKPPAEFGRIDEVGSTPTAKRFVYELLNPGDSDLITILADQPARVQVFAKAPNLSLENETPSDPTSWMDWLAVFGAVIAALSSLLSLSLKYASEKHIWPLG